MGWKQKDVKGDGSCFYRSIYVSANNYLTGSLIKDILDCFGIKLNNINEETFVKAIRKSLGNKIINGIYDKKIEYEKELVLTNTSIESENARQRQINETVGLYEYLINNAKEEINSNSSSSNSSSSNSSSSNSSSSNSSNIGLYTAIMEEATAEISDEYGDPQKLLNTSKKDFYDFIGKQVQNISVFASDYDINLIKYILQKCNIHINNFEDKKYTKLTHSTEIRTVDGLKKMNTLNIQRIGRNHYNAWIEGDDNNRNRKTHKNKKSQGNSTIQTLREKILEEKAKEEKKPQGNSTIQTLREKILEEKTKEEKKNNNEVSNTESVWKIVEGAKNEMNLEKKLKMRKWLKKIQTKKNKK